MRIFFFPSTTMLMAALVGLTFSSQSFAQDEYQTSPRSSVMEAPVVTFTDQTEVAPGPVSTDAPVLYYEEMPQHETYMPVVEAAPAPKKPKANPAAKAYKGLFYANDFSYLNDSYDGPRFFGDSWKNMKVGESGRLSIGGEMRYRYHSEQGMGRQAGQLGFQDTNNEFGLARLRLFANYKVNDKIRLFAEGIYADVAHSNDEYLPRGIDRNFGDLLNLFADVKVTDNTSVRIGRQELLFGAQRLVSPLDWANTRRTFTGVRSTSKFDNWDIDAFWTQPVPVVRNEFDSGDENADFYGTYMTYKGLENASLEMYYLGLNRENNINLDTFGARLSGNKAGWLYDIEGSMQTGQQLALGQSHEAYAVTAGIGRKFNDLAWKPALWFFYDYASGNNPGSADTFERYNQLFPLAHKYLGFIDAVARANIASPNIRLVMNPTKKLKLLMWYHNFTAARQDDIVPGVAVPSAQRLDSKDFGNELDFIASLNINERSNVTAGYSHLWAGDKILGNNDADFFYLQVTRRF